MDIKIKNDDRIFHMFMTIILCLAILMMIAVVSSDGDDERNNAPFINGDGYTNTTTAGLSR